MLVPSFSIFKTKKKQLATRHSWINQLTGPECLSYHWRIYLIITEGEGAVVSVVSHPSGFLKGLSGNTWDLLLKMPSKNFRFWAREERREGCKSWRRGRGEWEECSGQNIKASLRNSLCLPAQGQANKVEFQKEAVTEPEVVAHAFYPRTQEVGTVRTLFLATMIYLSSNPAKTTQWDAVLKQSKTKTKESKRKKKRSTYWTCWVLKRKLKEDRKVRREHSGLGMSPGNEKGSWEWLWPRYIVYIIYIVYMCETIKAKFN